jgi:hypothetical protein
MAKKVDLAKAKEKKQRIIALVGGLLLLGLLAFQVPRVMKQLNKKPPPRSYASTTATAPTGTPSLAAPTLSGNEQAATGAGATDGSSLASGDVAPPAEDGQLGSFSRFASKDPFAQQLSDDTTGSASASASLSSSGGASSPAGGSASPGLSSSGSGSTPSQAAPSGGSSQPVPGSAVISVNGALMSVTTGTDFPQPSASDGSAQPLFHLLKLTAHTARITIVGGSYSNGAPAGTLRENKPLTLMNTADGTKYRLILKPQGTAVPGAAGTTGTTPTVTLPASTP